MEKLTNKQTNKETVLYTSNKYLILSSAKANSSRCQYFTHSPHWHFWQGRKRYGKDATVKMLKNKNLGWNPDSCRASLVQFTLSQFITVHHCSLFTVLQLTTVCVIMFYPSQHILIICTCWWDCIKRFTKMYILYHLLFICLFCNLIRKVKKQAG